MAGSGSVVGHPSFEAGRYEVCPGRESSVKGGDSHTGSAGDLLQGGVQSPLGEHLLGRGEYPLPISLGVGPQAGGAPGVGDHGRDPAGRTAPVRHLDHDPSLREPEDSLQL